ncbi:HK97 gp10 family phage protein [Blautia coccoides]|uniref:HK97-gp10 family putative phage morphogenesis protein n=1 Tax=Blautia producta TaxID=33035 RepID=UPI0028A3D801|nr:HK97-gp10 family putative phage morphogenesis protein [Blautia coccoides]MDT4373005.1 HK97 gp10 family phage protein [Blautia coccoides]
MAFDIHGFDELLQEMELLGDFDEIAPKMLEEAAPILEKEVVRQASTHWDSGDMVKSIKKTGASAGKTGGYYLAVRPTGKDKKGVRNMEKMAYFEYGVKGRPAAPILTTAVNNAEPGVMKKMQEVFDREAGAE